MGKSKFENLTTEQTFRVFDNLSKLGVMYVCIEGGEPLVRKDILDILHYAKVEKNMIVQFVTNATLLHTVDMNELMPLIDNLVLSLDAVNQEKYKEIRGYNGSFDKIIENMKEAIAISKEYNTLVTTNTVLSKLNVNNLEKIMRFSYENLKTNLCAVTLLITGLAGEYWAKKLMPSQQEINKAVDVILKFKKKYPVAITTKYYKMLCSGKFNYNCSAYTSVGIDFKGLAHIPCWNFLDKTIDLVEVDDIRKVWFSGEVQSIFKKYLNCNKCKIHCVVDNGLLFGRPWENLDSWVEYIKTIKEAFDRKKLSCVDQQGFEP